MGKKKESKKGLKLSENEKAELSFFMDRLRMQDPQGPSLENCLRSLKQALARREVLAAALLEALSLEGSPVCFRAFCELQGIVRDKRLARIVRQAAYRFRQKGFVQPEPLTLAEKSTPVVLIKAEEVINESFMVVGVKEGLFHYGAFVHARDERQPYGVSLLLGAGLVFHDLVVVPMSRKSFRKLLRQAAEQMESRIHEIPLGHLARLLETMAELGRLPNEKRVHVAKARKLLQPHALQDARPLFVQLWEEKGRTPLRNIEMHDLVDFLTQNVSIIPYESLFPDSLALEAVVHTLRTLQDSVIEVSEHLKRERVLEALRSATRRLLPLTACRLLAKHWEELALWWLMDSNEPNEAEKIFSLAEHVRTVEDSGLSPILNRVVEMACAVFHKFITNDLESDFRRLHEVTIAPEEELVQTSAGLYVPRLVLE
ncbi:hypothetical protein [Desulfosoma caldarium]|uniref:Uncharacterized protein n=1 Tax=Desulfosoma caldarium TaxID=610254 RepID=A0A3N1VKF8_9BACT|nr:hypothetical protein [Desulfosoma caldarium]ROR03293.1 hypothetical protein EDC27_0559 [Desulfosoma caldarium]